MWRFHPGDDPDGKLGWAKPDLDDSSWPLLRSNTGWGEQGYKGYTGFASYRFKVLLPKQNQNATKVRRQREQPDDIKMDQTDPP